jgi:peroxiredoxin
MNFRQTVLYSMMMRGLSILALLGMMRVALKAQVVAPIPQEGPTVESGRTPGSKQTENGDVASGEQKMGGQNDPLASAKGKKALVLFFLGADCPISNAYAPEIKRICDRYTAQNVAFAMVYPDPDLSLADAQKHAKTYGLTYPVFIDPHQRLTRLAGAKVTPQSAVFAPNESLLYRGRIDNLYVDFGKRRFAATQHDLRAALDAIIAGKAVHEKFTQAVGCFIPTVVRH